MVKLEEKTQHEPDRKSLICNAGGKDLFGRARVATGKYVGSLVGAKLFVKRVSISSFLSVSVGDGRGRTRLLLFVELYLLSSIF